MKLVYIANFSARATSFYTVFTPTFQTKYYLELKSDSTELKCIAVDILKNANASEFELIYNHCKTTFRERSVWWIIEPVFKETFARKVAYAKSDDCLDSTNRLENCFEQFEKITVSKLPIYRGHYLMILFLIENEYAHRLTEEQWDGIFIYMHNFLEELVKKSHFSVRI